MWLMIDKAFGTSPRAVIRRQGLLAANVMRGVAVVFLGAVAGIWLTVGVNLAVHFFGEHRTAAIVLVDTSRKTASVEYVYKSAGASLQDRQEISEAQARALHVGEAIGIKSLAVAGHHFSRLDESAREY